MIKVVRKPDNSVFQIDGARGRPIVPIPIGGDGLIFVAGTLRETIGIAAPGPYRFEDEIHGSCVLFGVADGVLAQVRARLNPASPLGCGDARAWTIIQQLCNSAQCGFDGTAESLHGEPPLDLANYGADVGNWQHNSVVQLRPPNP